MQENLDLRWIPPSEYPMLGDKYCEGSVRLVSFLNDVAVERWSRVETAVDGETRETTDLGPVYNNPEANATTKATGGVEAETLPQPSSTVTSGSAGTAAAETGCGEGTISWTQAIIEGFPEVPDGEVLTSVLQIECEGLLQFLAPTSLELPVSSTVSEDATPLTTDGKTHTAADVAEVSLIAGLVPIGAATQPTAAPLREAEIAVLVAMRLRRYSQTMVWDIAVDETAHLSERSITIISLDPVKAMSLKGETNVDLEAELLIKTKDYSWSSIVSLLNIPAVMKNISCIKGLFPDFMF
jgi:hypothetical protein